jgi:hypothetical protein
MNQEINRKVSVLAELGSSRSIPKWHSLADFADLLKEELILAEWVNNGLTTLTPSGDQFVSHLWDQLMRFTGTTDAGFTSLDELRQAIGGRR